MNNWIDEQSEALRMWLTHTTCPMLATLADGSILWCNESYEKLVDYTLVELVGSDDQPGISWQTLTIHDEDLEADIFMAGQVVEGKRVSYQIQKTYRKKSGEPVSVIIHVRRFPASGGFVVFLVTAIPLDHGYQHAVAEITGVRRLMAELVAKQDNTQSRSTIRELWDWTCAYPKTAAMVWLFVVGLIFGERAFEMIERIKGIFWP